MKRARTSIRRLPRSEAKPENEIIRVRTSIRLLPCSFFLCAFSIFSCGCQNKDADHLAGLGARLAQKAQGLLPPGGRSLLGSWQTVPLHLGDLAADARVSARLSWDKTLADAEIQVNAVGGSVVELQGKVRNEEQQRRAVELAQTTLGVEKVLDRLEIGP